MSKVESRDLKFALELGRAIQVAGEAFQAVVTAKLPDASPSEEEDLRSAAAAPTPTRSREEIRFELLCLEKVDPNVVDVRPADYSSPSSSGKARKKLERVVGRSEKASVTMNLSRQHPKKCYSLVMAVPEEFPPTYMGTGVSYAYKLKVSLVKVVPSKKGDDFREIEKCSTSFALCFWTATGTTAQPQQNSGSGRPCELPAIDVEETFTLKVCAIDESNGHLERQVKASFTSPEKRSESGRSAAVSARSGAGGHPNTSSTSPGYSPLRDHDLPEFMNLRRVGSNSLEDGDLLPNEAPKTYNIFCSDTCLVHLHVLGLIGKNIAQPGYLMECVLDFVPTESYMCSHVSIELVTEETVLCPKQTHIQKYAKQVFESSDITLSCRRTSFTFNVPRNCHPTFETDKVKVNWELRFCFQTCKREEKGSAGTGKLQSSGELNWKLPLVMSLLL